MGTKRTNKVGTTAKCRTSKPAPRTTTSKKRPDVSAQKRNQVAKAIKNEKQILESMTDVPRIANTSKDYERIMREVVGLDDWRLIILEAVAQAKDGDKHARKWISDYLLGLPIQRVVSENPYADNPYIEASDEELKELARVILNN